MGWCQCQLPAPGMAPVERDGPDARMRSRACTGRQRLGVGRGRTEKLLGDPEQEDAELEALPTRLAKPVSAGAAAAGATVPASPGSPPPADAACSEPAAMPSWQRGGAAWDPSSLSLRPGQGSPPAVSARDALPRPCPFPGCSGDGSGALSVPAGSGTRCQRGACRCERAAWLCRAQLRRAQLRRRARCRGRAGRC